VNGGPLGGALPLLVLRALLVGIGVWILRWREWRSMMINGRGSMREVDRVTEHLLK
jgi:hypothetical protein